MFNRPSFRSQLSKHDTTQVSQSYISENQNSQSFNYRENVSNNPKALTSSIVMQLQSSIGNQAVMQLFSDVEATSRNNDLFQLNNLEDEEKHNPLNRTTPFSGLPEPLKAQIESLSGVSMDNVKVHYNSDKPSEVQALAYTQGNDIYVAPGQEKHLPHEAWHVVQQAQGRVKPTLQMKSDLLVNDDVGLESEADIMSKKAEQLTPEQQSKHPNTSQKQLSPFSTTLGVIPTQFRKLNIGKSKIVNLQKAKENKSFIEAISTYYEEFGEDRVLYFAGQLFSVEGSDIASLEQFMIELRYDLETKTLPESEPLTIQERYLTEYGWKRAASDSAKAVPGAKMPQLKLYRTMSIEDWKSLLKGDYNVLVGGHLGDFKQALRYFLGKSSDTKVMVEFTLKVGSEKLLFSKGLAFPIEKNRSSKLKKMAEVIGGKSYPVSSKSEGTSKEAIGIKSESEGEAGFSIGIGGGTTPELFHKLVESIELKQVGERFTVDNGNTSDIETDANRLLHVNNCLINAISLAARGHMPTLEELMVIRSTLGNYGEMMLATPQVVQLIQNTLNIVNPITVLYPSAPAENFVGVGNVLSIYHVNGNHFTHNNSELDMSVYEVKADSLK